MNGLKRFMFCIVIASAGAVLLFFILAEKARRAIDRIMNGRDV